MIEHTFTSGEELLALCHAENIPISEAAVLYELTQEEMADMNAQLFACKMPNFTPSGRPIVSIINTDDIDKLFK